MCLRNNIGVRAMTYTSARSLIAGLGLTLVTASAFAQTNAGQSAASTAAQAPAAHAAAAVSNDGGGEGPMGHIPQAVLDQLALGPTQKAQFDSVQVARKDMQASKQSLRAEQQKAMAELLSKDVIDPRAMLAQHKQMRSAIETKMDVVQQKWLAFWDGLSPSQKLTLSNYVKSKHAAHTQKKPVAAKG
jgi:Spy/CpxP family protein refolding chaperone